MSGYLDPAIPSVDDNSPVARENAERERHQETAEIEFKHMFDDPSEYLETLPVGVLTFRSQSSSGISN